MFGQFNQKITPIAELWVVTFELSKNGVQMDCEKIINMENVQQGIQEVFEYISDLNSQGYTLDHMKFNRKNNEPSLRGGRRK